MSGRAESDRQTGALAQRGKTRVADERVRPMQHLESNNVADPEVERLLEVSERFSRSPRPSDTSAQSSGETKRPSAEMLQTLQDRSRLVLPAVFGIGFAERAEADGAVAQLDATLDFTKALVLVVHRPGKKPETQVRERRTPRRAPACGTARQLPPGSDPPAKARSRDGR